MADIHWDWYRKVGKFTCKGSFALPMGLSDRRRGATSRRRQIRTISTTIFVIALASIVAAGCSATRKSGMPIEESGFLCDYSLLSETDSAIPGDFGPRPKLRYINPDADWAGHKKVLVDPVTFFSSKDVKPPREVQILLNYFWAELREELKRDYELVDSPQPATLRLTIALTHAGERRVTLDTISIYVPFSRALTELQGITHGKPSFVGHAKAEAKMTDAATGTLLLAAIDKRVGGKTFKDFDSWSDVRAVVDYWVKLTVFRLCLLRGESDCKPPTG
jgi:hypothetical protein